MATGDGIEEDEEKDTVKSAPDRAQIPKGGPKDKRPLERPADKDKKPKK